MFSDAKDYFSRTPVPKEDTEAALSDAALAPGINALAAKKKEEDKLAKYIKQDDEASASIKDYVPDVQIKGYKAGDFLCFQKIELPRSFIEGISVGEHGKPPGDNFSEIFRSWAVEKAMDTRIELRMVSGQTHRVTCHRTQTDILLNALREAWKNGKAK